MRMEGVKIGEAIKELRKIQNITKEQLSEKTGISVSHLEKIEAGSRNHGINTYQKLLYFLCSIYGQYFRSHSTEL